MKAKKYNSKATSALLALATAAFLGILLAPSLAFGEWNFDPQCSEPLVSEVEVIDAAAMLMLDRSGSMGGLGDEYCCDCPWYHDGTCGYCCGNSLWSIAVGAINQAVDSLHEDLFFGLGLFYGSSTAQIRVEASETSYQEIPGILASESPNSYTPTAQALARIRNSDTLNDPALAAAGVLITDGFPNDASHAIEEACTTREAGMAQYIVGLGGATDQNYNNMLAAAAGTGCCGATAEEGCPNGLGDDPCSDDFSSHPSTCFGSYQAYDQTEFRNVLMSIGQEIACTFPLDVSGWPDGIPNDPDVVLVEIEGAGGLERVHHRDSDNADPPDEGWYFASSARDRISLTAGFCERVTNPNDVQQVITQVACNCLQVHEGEPCRIPVVAAESCPAGTRVCQDDQNWTCEGSAEPMHDDCPFYDCPSPDNLPETCHLDNELIYYSHPVHPRIESEGDYDPDREPTRCNVGTVICVEDQGSWCEPFRPMPELCDGLDNDCDGRIDNISASWSTGNFTPIPDDYTYPGAACYENDYCVCSGSRERNVHRGAGVTEEEEYDAFLAAYESYIDNADEPCICHAPLAP